ncbi:bifunctional proline dehydrogenase/L-glutamate gamma-semialdehyde dehydrogenase PutA [Pseudoruegeria sp. SHC-113]|uniref:bifunctional proline dehydrogenase/L-glutamate gamma-semialdehyde dehydrogenase PutA n=1 Tax=Pseudoruegeria sp. SHC-113 TaxID=2855439 RepID=UPI0021BB04FD|nr:bifunctional proline dehydrogenase/L-glutamate gamma-semialdehyde dehydrogenase PutA [Pseudoruegeria sp. SHC-113]MCT8161902.1 bifunctional proline dehydrogenase/L-glutamate gamma-semialdehyde dehydrogenase PutA [Pseudoruegeria sp. SHC-113]
MTAPLAEIRQTIRALHFTGEDVLLADLRAANAPSEALRAKAHERATGLVEAIRGQAEPGLMEVFLAEYGLSTKEGIALMCLAEALLRVPDSETVDALIEDKIAPSAWGEHLGHSSSHLVNASTWALMLTGKVLSDGEGLASVLRGAIRRVGEPVIRVAVGRAMREMGHQFVLGETIEKAVKRGQGRVSQGYTYSYDMLGEAALTARDADAFFTAYAEAINALSPQCTSDDIRENPGISVKLSALYPRYEYTHAEGVMADLVPRVKELAKMAAHAGMGFNIDAEEADRLDISLDVIEAVLRDPALKSWEGFGVVVQAYGKRAGAVLDWLHGLAEAQDRRIMVRLVKGAYWDTEIKRAQAEGLPGFPVFTRKVATDVAYICHAQKLLGMTDRIYPQFATHNAHTVAAILEMAQDLQAFEFQRLHGMGEALHDIVKQRAGTRCRIYAPVGAHRDLLAYLVRRLLENGANSSFVNQIVDEAVPAAAVAADPFEALDAAGRNAAVVRPADLFRPERANARGWDVNDPLHAAEIEAARAPFAQKTYAVAPLLAEGVAAPEGQSLEIRNPARSEDVIGTVQLASPELAESAVAAARVWAAPVAERRAVLEKAADLYEAHFGEIFALLAREAGKSWRDAIAELREAVDFLRYYAARAELEPNGALGTVTCISPWNFPLAIFTGQLSAALAAGNAVLAKPAETTNAIAAFATGLLHEAGVPRAALQLLPGAGREIGPVLTGSANVSGVCFTGSTATAQSINRTMAEALSPDAPLIAETGGLNAMIVDSTALPEQAVRDIVASAFQSAGQRCSALRLLYVQEDVAPAILKMLSGAMDALVMGDPWQAATDVGPVINAAAKAGIDAHVEAARKKGRLVKQLKAPSEGTFVGPAVIRVSGMADLEKEIFGPVLHVATFRADALERVVEEINASGYGLTFGVHSRIDSRVDELVRKIRVGNIYVNRNQIGAIVGSQPFGGEGLSGTGPKAGGPAYLSRFTRPEAAQVAGAEAGPVADVAKVQAALDAARPRGGLLLGTESLPGPTGESNRLSVFGRGTVLCLGPTLEAAKAQAEIARREGCAAVTVAPGGDVDGVLGAEALTSLKGVDLVAYWGGGDPARACRIALAARSGAMVPLACQGDLAARCRLERHVCVDTTAAGGNAALLASAGG